MPGLPENQQARSNMPGSSSGGMTGPEQVAHQFLQNLPVTSLLLIALSGGSDSTGLLIAFHRACQASGRRLIAATVDHRLRQGSTEDARQAGALCDTLGIRHYILPWDGAKPATGLQAAARLVRYRLLTDLADKTGSSAILTGHNADDQAETIAMRHDRSTDGATGLSGMAPAVLVDGRVWVYRPFLSLRRQEIRNFLSQHSVGWIDDPSNANSGFERVRVRLRLAESGLEKPVGQGGANRLQTCKAAGEFLKRNLDFPSGQVACLDLTGFDRDDPAHRLALETVVAVAGGRSHRPGLQSATRLHDFVAAGIPGRMTTARAVIDLRRGGLFVYRENRSLPMMHIAPQESVIWDGRYRISNRGDREIVACPGPIGVALIEASIFETSGGQTVPDGVMRRMGVTLPHRQDPADGEVTGIAVSRVISIYTDFLPCFELPLAEVLADKMGLGAPPALPVLPEAEICCQ